MQCSAVQCSAVRCGTGHCGRFLCCNWARYGAGQENIDVKANTFCSFWFFRVQLPGWGQGWKTSLRRQYKTYIENNEDPDIGNVTGSKDTTVLNFLG